MHYLLSARGKFGKWSHFLITCIKWLALDILCLILDISFVELDILSSSGFAKPPFSWNEVEEAAEAGFRGMVCCWMVFSRSPTFSRVSSRPVDNEKNYTNWVCTCTVVSIYVLCTLLQRRKKWSTNWMYFHKWRTLFLTHVSSTKVHVHTFLWHTDTSNLFTRLENTVSTKRVRAVC